VTKKRKKSMANSSFFENKDCEYYPCHSNLKEINCLFCYCVLFWDCPFENGGAKGNGMECPDCTFPHERGNYASVMQLLRNMYDKRKE
jgi:Zn-finger protein